MYLYYNLLTTIWLKKVDERPVLTAILNLVSKPVLFSPKRCQSTSHDCSSRSYDGRRFFNPQKMCTIFIQIYSNTWLSGNFRYTVKKTNVICMKSERQMCIFIYIFLSWHPVSYASFTYWFFHTHVYDNILYGSIAAK